MAKTGCVCGVTLWNGYCPGGINWDVFPKWQAEEIIREYPEYDILEVADSIADKFDNGEFRDIWLCRRCRRIKIWDIDGKFICYKKKPFDQSISPEKIFQFEEWLAYSDWDLEEEKTLTYALEHPFRSHRYFLTEDKDKIFVYNTDLCVIEFIYAVETREIDEDLFQDEHGVYKNIYIQEGENKVFKGSFYQDGTEVVYDYPNGRLSDAIYGAVIGDALGVPFEGMVRGSFKCTGITGFGTHDQPAGTWSDASSMMLATCKSLKDNNGKIKIDDMRSAFMKWMNEGEFSPNGEVFDIEKVTSKALTTGLPQEDEYSDGNGSLMRILPLAFIDCTDDDIRDVSAITHGHWIAKEACVIYVNIIKDCIGGKRLADVIRSLDLPKPFDRLNQIETLSEEQIRSTGYVVDTLEAALWCVLNSDDYKDCLLKAVNLGNDTATVAALTGGLAGAVCYSFDAIPDPWFNEIKNNDLIQSCLF